VLIYEGINDLWANHVAENEFKNDYSHLSPWYKRNFLLSHSIVCRNFYNRYIYQKPKYFANGSSFQSIKTFKMNLENLIDLIRKDKGVPILMTFAWNIPKNYTLETFRSDKLGYNNPENYDECGVELWGSVDYVREGLKRINEVIYEMANKKKVFLVDQNKLMSQDINFFGDVCHFSNEGTDQFIGNIVNFFIANKLLEKRKSTVSPLRCALSQ